MSGKYSIFQIANWFLAKENMPHKKLQKLCYYAVAWGYALFDAPITAEPVFEAWIHGPVSVSLYQKYRDYAPWVNLTPDFDYKNVFDDDTEDLLESVWLTYGEDSGNSLEVLTHKELPWINARTGFKPLEYCTNPINTDDMKNYYRSIYSGGDS
ncbi:MAG: DUF4065 domain-containing protein [Clostridiales bacterium]|nr:DUF4065 domain-containing protein [Clostridiales bacterium]